MRNRFVVALGFAAAITHSVAAVADIAAGRAATADDQSSRHHSVRHGGPHRHAAERPEVLRASELEAGRARVAAAGGQGGIDQRGRRSAGPGASHRAHGVQRQRAFQAGRAGVVLRIVWRAPRSARQCLHELRRNGLHARSPDRQARGREPGADRARRLRRRPDAQPRRNRQGTRRRHRRVARRPGRRLADPRQAVADRLLQIALRRSAADWQAGDSSRGARRAAAHRSTTPGTGPIGLPSSPSATSIRRSSSRASGRRSATSRRAGPRRRIPTAPFRSTINRSSASSPIRR